MKFPDSEILVLRLDHSKRFGLISLSGGYYQCVPLTPDNMSLSCERLSFTPKDAIHEKCVS